jgi:hypothetical protein
MAKNKKLAKKKNLTYDDGKLSPQAGSGQNNSAMREKVPLYNLSDSEKEIKNDNNARIILGRDRVSDISSGYGGKGHTRTGAIDLVVGLQGWNPGENYKIDKDTGEESFGFADRNFGSMKDGNPGDAARIYISQRANIDDYFGIAEGNVGRSILDSAIAMKADSVRIMARKGIKLVTQKNPPGKNSLGGEMTAQYGIDLIAGNLDYGTGLEQKLEKFVPGIFERPPKHPLQPIPKGDNLVHFLEIVLDNILLLNAINAGMMMIIPLLSNATLSPKLGIGPTGPISTFPGLTDLSSVGAYLTLSQKQMSKLITMQKNVTSTRNNCLRSEGPNYINSKRNRTN